MLLRIFYLLECQRSIVTSRNSCKGKAACNMEDGKNVKCIVEGPILQPQSISIQKIQKKCVPHGNLTLAETHFDLTWTYILALVKMI